ncbi:MAG: hypothetical protein WC455_11990 [Dehalococcoidia bacterium]|jgi:hypothetical protein
MGDDDLRMGQVIQKCTDLDTRLTNIECKVDKILAIVNQWKGMIAVYGGIAAIVVTVAIKLIWK